MSLPSLPFCNYKNVICYRAHAPLYDSILYYVDPARFKPIRPPIPPTIPSSLNDWLSYLHLERYYTNFEAMGFAQKTPEDVIIMETLTEKDLMSMGITKLAHVNKLVKAVKKIKDLAFQGRTPEGWCFALFFILILILLP